MNTQWYNLSDADIIKEFKTNQNSGLTHEEVEAKRNIFGYNTLKPPKKKSALFRFFLQIHQPLVYVLILMVLMTLFGFVSFYISQKLGADILQARTVVVNSLVFMGITFMFSCRSFTLSAFTTGFKGNKYMLLGAVSMILLQILFTTTFIFQKAFKTVTLSACEWYIAISCAVLLMMIIEIEKWIIRYK